MTATPHQTPPDLPLPPLRLGPRPLPLHLAAQATMLLGSALALPNWKNGSLVWRPHLQPKAADLASQLGDLENPSFKAALEAEARRRVDAFVRGIQAYRRHPYHRALPPVPVIWQEGTTRLLDYSQPGADGPVTLVIPSLINRAYILDLTAKRSFMRYLGDKGARAFLVDWGAPGAAEKGFSLDDYIRGRLGRCLDFVLATAGRPALVGYCMGGLLGLGLGLLRQDDVSGLALLATPWDFHSPDDLQARQVKAMRRPLQDAIDSQGELPVDLLQSLFTTIDPGGIERKFRAFSRMTAKSAKARDFVALEDWLNDGVPLVGKVAQECLFGWYVDNDTAKGRWALGGDPVRPQSFIKPSLALIPAKDRIVPPASAMALAQALPKARIRVIEAGHIGMMTAGRAKTEVYGPLLRWLRRVAARP